MAQQQERSVDAFVPPHSLEAERSVLGGLLLDSLAWDKVAEHVVADDFYRRDHRLLFQHMGGLAEKNKPVDVITLAESLTSSADLDKVGGMPYLVELAKNTPTTVNIATYAEIIRDRSVLRRLLSASHEIADQCLNPAGREVAELLDEAERRIFQIAEKGHQRGGPENVKDLLTKTVERIDRLFNSDSQITGLSTGYVDFDEMTAGLQESDLIIVAGRPSMGKTALAVNMAEHAMIKAKKPVLLFSMEMPGESLVMRLISSLGHIDQHRLRTGKLADEDWPRFSMAVSMLSETKLYIDDTPGLSPTELRSRARRVAREQGELGMIVVDYLQLMQVPGSKENRTTEISTISRQLKLLAKELGVPVIALSQLNRELEHRPNKRPIMSDLRESGAIEQDADLIVFIYRDEVYNKESTDKGVAEIIIAKQRNGPIGTVRLSFQGQYCRFVNYAHERVEEYA